MAEYLLPNDTGLSVEDKRKVFSIWNRTIELSTNYPLKYRDKLCICGEKEQIEHVYKCQLLNSEKIFSKQSGGANKSNTIDFYKIMKK